MKGISFQNRILRVLLACISFGLQLQAQVDVMSFNIRYDHAADGANRWHERKHELTAFVLREHPDILGIQEGLLHQVAFLDSALQRYKYVGVGRDDGHQRGEFTAIFFDTIACSLLYTHTYWLSATPQQPSVGWDAALPRIVTYAALVTSSGKDTLHVFNCHYDHVGRQAQRNSSQMLLGLIDTLGLQQKAVILLGDFNSEAHQAPMLILQPHLNDARAISQEPVQGADYTFNGFGQEGVTPKLIDYILVKNLRVASFTCHTEKRQNGLYLSDHFAIRATVITQK